MEWSEFEREVNANINYVDIRLHLMYRQLLWTPSYVLWHKGWSNRRASRKASKAGWDRVSNMLNEICENRWTSIGYAIILFENKSDAMLAKLSWPGDLL